MVFDLAYLREIGARAWQDCEDVYFVSELLVYISLQLTKMDPQTATFKERQMNKLKIAVTVPFEWMVATYTQVLQERLLRRFDLTNLQVGTPLYFTGHRSDIVIVCGLRNSFKAGLAAYQH